MTSETAGPPVGPSPGEHSEVAGQPAAGAGDDSQLDAAADASQPPATGVAGRADIPFCGRLTGNAGCRLLTGIGGRIWLTGVARTGSRLARDF